MTTAQLRPWKSRYGDAPLDYDLLDAYPEIWEPLPDTGMQERPQQEFKEALRGWYGRRSDVFVSGNTGVYYEEGNRDAVFLPDCYVVFGEGADRLWHPYAYRIWEFGHPPAFALEIASQSTYRNDLGPSASSTPASASENTGVTTPLAASITASRWLVNIWWTGSIGNLSCTPGRTAWCGRTVPLCNSNCVGLPTNCNCGTRPRAESWAT